MVRNTSGNGPSLPFQVINLPGGQPSVILSAQDFAVLISLARLGAVLEETADDALLQKGLTIPDLSDDVMTKARALLGGVLRDDLAVTDILRLIRADFDDPYRAALGATRGAVEPLWPIPDDGDAEDAADLAADLAAYREAKARNEEVFPLAVAQRLVDGEHPIKVFREHRGMTQATLAKAVGLTAMYLSQVETRRRGGSTKALRRIAAALDVDLADLVV